MSAILIPIDSYDEGKCTKTPLVKNLCCQDNAVIETPIYTVVVIFGGGMKFPSAPLMVFVRERNCGHILLLNFYN